MGVEFHECLVLEAGPVHGLDRDFDSGFLLVLVGEFLQIVGRIPFCPQDGELGRCGRPARRQQRYACEQADPHSLEHGAPPESTLAMAMPLHAAAVAAGLLPPPGQACLNPR